MKAKVYCFSGHVAVASVKPGHLFTKCPICGNVALIGEEVVG